MQHNLQKAILHKVKMTLSEIVMMGLGRDQFMSYVCGVHRFKKKLTNNWTSLLQLLLYLNLVMFYVLRYHHHPSD